MSGAGLYLHIPYCRARCTYCAFYTVGDTGRDGRRRLVRALIQDMRRASRQGLAPEGTRVPPLRTLDVDTIYLGGGTPSLLPCDDIDRLVAAARELFRVREDAEITIEANPETVRTRAARRWRAAGVNRVSLGAQTFDAAVLARVGRRHRPSTIDRAVERLRQAEFRNLSLDLIAGLAPDALAGDLERATALRPEHLSVYLLEVDEEEIGGPTALGRQRARGLWRSPDPDWFADAYLGAVEFLRAAGLHRYEICNFARPGCESRHNLKYWRGEPVIGFGPSAHSHWEGERFRVPPDVGRYMEALEGGAPPARLLDRAGVGDRIAEAFFLGLRLEEGIDTEEIGERTGEDVARRHGPLIDELLQGGLMERSGRRLKLTNRGFLVSNEIFQRFLP
jgi:putative oxygen-independent coproporphyrinogen III oxidase